MAHKKAHQSKRITLVLDGKTLLICIPNATGYDAINEATGALEVVNMPDFNLCGKVGV